MSDAGPFTLWLCFSSVVCSGHTPFSRLASERKCSVSTDQLPCGEVLVLKELTHGEP